MGEIHYSPGENGGSEPANVQESLTLTQGSNVYMQIGMSNHLLFLLLFFKTNILGFVTAKRTNLFTISYAFYFK